MQVRNPTRSEVLHSSWLDTVQRPAGDGSAPDFHRDGSLWDDDFDRDPSPQGYRAGRSGETEAEQRETMPWPFDAAY